MEELFKKACQISLQIEKDYKKLGCKIDEVIRISDQLIREIKYSKEINNKDREQLLMAAVIMKNKALELKK